MIRNYKMVRKKINSSASSHATLPPIFMNASLSRSFSLASLTAITLLAPLATHALGIQVMIKGETITFIDVPQTAWFAEYVRDAAESGIVNGYKDTQGKLTGKFGPSNSVTLAEALKIATEGAGYDEELYGSMVESGTSHWASAYVSIGQAEDFEFMRNKSRILWNDPATRAEVASFFTSAFLLDTKDVTASGGRYEDVNMETSFAKSIELLSRDEILSGDTDTKSQATGKFRPNDEINRAEVVKMVIRARAEYGTPGVGRAPTENDVGNTESIVVYNGSDERGGFAPQILRIKKGDTVTFKNQSALPLWIASNPHPLHTGYSGFDSKKSLKSGETYTFTFTRIGSFGYHNEMHLSHKGTIIVGE